MWSKLHFLWIFIYFLIDLNDAVPVEMLPRFNHLGHRPNVSTNLAPELTSTTTTTPAPALQPEPANFEYALLGQDPKDQHWYRVSLTPKGAGSKSGGGYRAQFATRKLPPYNEQLAHKHDKTITDLLNWLEQSEERNLLKVYQNLLAHEAKEQEQANANKNTNTNTIEIESGNENESRPRQRQSKESNQPLLLLGDNEGGPQEELQEEKETITPSKIFNSTETDTKMVNNFVYFIKGLE